MKRLIVLFIFLISGVFTVYAQSKFPVALTGVDQVPTVRTGAMGSVNVWVKSDTLYAEGEFSNLQGTFWSAHIHFGKEGETGNRLFRIDANLSDDKQSGEFVADDNKFFLRQVQREALSNGNLYINIASSRHQHGEIRGQIPPIR